MDSQTLKLFNELNRALIKFRGVYSEWSKKHNISYNEMLVLYTLREFGFCTQKQICDSYMIPRQTINHTISSMRSNEFLELSSDYSRGREKAFVLTEKGKLYAEPLLNSINKLEELTVESMSKDKISAMTKLVLEFDIVLNQSLNEEA